MNAVLVEPGGGTPQLAHDIAVHVALARSRYLRREDVPADVVEKERATLEAITRNEGKPEQAIGKIVEGRLNGYSKRSASWSSRTPRTTSSRSASSSATPPWSGTPRSRSAEHPSGRSRRTVSRDRSPRWRRVVLGCPASRPTPRASACRPRSSTRSPRSGRGQAGVRGRPGHRGRGRQLLARSQGGGPGDGPGPGRLHGDDRNGHEARWPSRTAWNAWTSPPG